MFETNPRRLNDAQLRNAELLIDDPLAVEGLSHDRPVDGFAPTIIAEYHLPKESMVRCCYCEQRQHHQHGFVAEFTPASRHLIGSECGQSKLDMQFQAARSSHKDLRSRQSYLRRLDQISKCANAIIGACDVILKADVLREIEAASKTLDVRASDLMIRLRASNGSLYEDVRVRDLAAETEKDEKQGVRRFKNERRLIGHLKGRGIFKANEFRLRFKHMKDELRNVVSINRHDTDNLTTSELKKALKAFDAAFEDANEAVGEINRASTFFSPENLALLAQWAASNSSTRVEVDESILIANGLEIPAISSSQLSHITYNR